MSGTEDVLEIRNLAVEYTSGKSVVHAVNGMSFRMKENETLALVGETGAGKTTVAKAIMRILPEPPSRIKGGEILFKNRDILKLSATEMFSIRGKEVAMIFQDPMTALNPLMTVGNQIEEGIFLHNDCERAEAKEKAVEMLEMVGIPKKRYREYPFQFSGGMKQRVVIAMALACNPSLLLADEPTTALDVTIQAQVLELIRELKQKYSTSMILITHDLGVVAQNSDTVAVIYAGKIIEYGTKEQVFTCRSHPYTQGLFDSLPSMNVGRLRLQPIPGSTPDPTDLPDGCAFRPRCSFAHEQCTQELPLFDIGNGHFCRCSKYSNPRDGIKNEAFT
jgi:peptide/nickel transport system ATP-binding protein